jgi:transposase
MDKTFRAWDLEQQFLFPPSVKDFVPRGHLSEFVRDLVRNELDLSEIFSRYEERRGQPPYHPALMTALVLYACCRGIYSSRKIEQACEERVDFMALTALAKPDHSTIWEFRTVHRKALENLFVQVLSLCRDAGMAKLGHVALDGTKVKANASKHAAMSYARMLEVEPELAKLVKEWLDTADRTDQAEDEELGAGKRGDEIPDFVKAKIRKLLKIQEAKARLEREAKEKAERLREERERKEREEGRKAGGPGPKALEGVPEPKAQSNFTDPESRIMKTANGFEQAWNCEAAVSEDQVIVARDVTDRQNDVDELVPMVDQIQAATGEYPAQVSADTGFCSESNLEETGRRGIDPYLATGRQKHGSASATRSLPRGGPRTLAMRQKLVEQGFLSPYRLRKQTVEPVFGQIKQARGFRQFLHRGREKVRAEWSLLCTAHNLLKLFQGRTVCAFGG